MLPGPPGERVSVVEVASGTGEVTQLILDERDERDERERPATLIGIEPSSVALEIVPERLAGRAAVQFAHTATLLHQARPLLDPS